VWFTSIHYGTRHSFIVVHVSTFFVLCFPCVVYLEATMKFYSTSLLEIPLSIITNTKNYAHGFRFTSSSSISQEVLIVSLSSEYFHFDKSYLPVGCSILVDLLFKIHIYFHLNILYFYNNVIILTLCRYWRYLQRNYLFLVPTVKQVHDRVVLVPFAL